MELKQIRNNLITREKELVMKYNAEGITVVENVELFSIKKMLSIDAKCFRWECPDCGLEAFSEEDIEHKCEY